METNLLRANAGQEAIDVKEALLYLKPCQFQCSKALEIYKNYQVKIVVDPALQPKTT